MYKSPEAALGEASILANQSGWRDWRACQEAFPAEKKDAKNIQLHVHTKIYNFTHTQNKILHEHTKIYNFTHSKTIKYFTHTQKYTTSRRELHNFMHVIMQIKRFNNSQRGKTILGGREAAHFQALLPQFRPIISSPPPVVLS